MSRTAEFRTWIAHHLAGTAAQVAAALPLLFVTALLAHTEGLFYAGKFTVVAGAAAAAFATGLWGFRSYVVLDGFAEFAARDYVVARLFAVAVAGVVTVVVGLWMHVPSLLIAAVVLFRTSDSAIDLTFAFTQVARSTTWAMNEFAVQHSSKLFLLVVIGGLAFVQTAISPQVLIASSGAIACIAAIGILIYRIGREPLFGFDVSVLGTLFFRTRWFALAAVFCALITSAPRIVVGLLYHGNLLGVSGISLSVSTLFGMIFYTTWLRFLPLFGDPTLRPAMARRFLLETIVVAATAALASWLVLPPLTALVFGFHSVEYTRIAGEILVASVVFSAGMNIANFYKITRAQWFESVVYVVPIVFVGLMAVVDHMRSIATMLVVAGLLMGFLSLPALWLVRQEAGRLKRRVGGGVAVFARIASYPAPRVIRMMLVASDTGYECSFAGARREVGLPIEEIWSGWRVERLGQPYPLLNGTRPLFFVMSVIRYNIALYRHLIRRRPMLLHASDCETMPAAILYKLRFGTRLIYNIHDNVAQRYVVPWIVSALLNGFEGLLVLCADVTIVPEAFRRTALPVWCRRKVSVIRNAPVDCGFSPPPPCVDRRISMFVGGWIDQGRGVRGLLALADACPSIELRFAGEGSAELIALLKAHPRVTYLGFLNYDAAIEETRQCHIVPALYDPARPINRFAASNKFADALSLGRPVLVNSELKIAGEFGNNPAVLTIPYAEIAQSADKIVRLVSDSNRYAEACRSARALYETEYSWQMVRAAIQKALGDRDEAIPGEVASTDIISPIGTATWP